MTRPTPRSFGEPVWGSEELYLSLGQAHGSTDAPPPSPPSLWLPGRDGYHLVDLTPPARPIGFTARPKAGA